MPLASSTALLIVAASTGGKSKGGGIGFLFPLLLIGVVGYMFLIRPARARQRAALANRGEPRRTILRPGLYFPPAPVGCRGFLLVLGNWGLRIFSLNQYRHNLFQHVKFGRIEQMHLFQQPTRTHRAGRILALP